MEPSSGSESQMELAAVLSRDIRAAVAGLIVSANAITEALGQAGEPRDAAAARRFAGRVEPEARRLTQLVHELVELAKVATPIEQAAPELARQPVTAQPGGVRALLVAADPVTGDALDFLLRQQGFTVVLATTGLAALDSFGQHGADVILLDTALPDMPGTELCRTLRNQSDVPIILLSARDSDVDVVLGLELGADDYVLKPYSPRALLARIRAVLRRRQPAPGTPPAAGTTVHVGPVRLDEGRYTVTVRGENVQLRLKEFELLALLLRNAGRVLTRGQLIDRVWGIDYAGDTKTLDVHIKRLRDKLELDPANPRYVVTVRGLGYKFEP